MFFNLILITFEANVNLHSTKAWRRDGYATTNLVRSRKTVIGKNHLSIKSLQHYGSYVRISSRIFFWSKVLNQCAPSKLSVVSRGLKKGLTEARKCICWFPNPITVAHFLTFITHAFSSMHMHMQWGMVFTPMIDATLGSLLTNGQFSTLFVLKYLTKKSMSNNCLSFVFFFKFVGTFECKD